MNCLVIGGSGQLGNELMTALKMQEKTFIAPNSNILDITNGLQLAEIMGNFLPNVVFNVAADTNVNKAQTSISRTLSINAIGPWNLAIECKLVGAKLIHISTEYVFSGEKPGRRFSHERISAKFNNFSYCLALFPFRQEFCENYGKKSIV
jgi:dTDP-4-dehydrorhamnose reductase